jgi:hypothetical protein
MYNFYHKFGFHEMSYNISATWESAYVDLRLGGSKVHYHSHVWGMGFGYTEPVLLTFGFGANIRHRSNPWNIGLFFRNFDDNVATHATSRYVMDDRVLELQSASVQYRLASKKLKQKLHTESILFSINANELFYLSTIKQERGLSYPYTRSLTFSLQLNF